MRVRLRLAVCVCKSERESIVDSNTERGEVKGRVREVVLKKKYM